MRTRSRSGASPDPLGCVAGNMPKATANLTKIVKQLRAPGGKQVQIIGSTAPGAYRPFVTTTLQPNGVIPVPVETVCRLTFFCTRMDIHMTTPGYAVTTRLEAQALAPRPVTG